MNQKVAQVNGTSKPVLTAKTKRYKETIKGGRGWDWELLQTLYTSSPGFRVACLMQCASMHACVCGSGVGALLCACMLGCLCLFLSVINVYICTPVKYPRLFMRYDAVSMINHLTSAPPPPPPPNTPLTKNIRNFQTKLTFKDMHALSVHLSLPLSLLLSFSHKGMLFVTILKCMHN